MYSGHRLSECHIKSGLKWKNWTHKCLYLPQMIIRKSSNDCQTEAWLVVTGQQWVLAVVIWCPAVWPSVQTSRPAELHLAQSPVRPPGGKTSLRHHWDITHSQSSQQSQSGENGEKKLRMRIVFIFRNSKARLWTVGRLVTKYLLI